MSAPAERDPAIFGARARALVVLVALVSLLGTTGAIVFGRSLAPPPPGPTDSFGRGPIGHRALLDTLERLGVTVTRWTERDHALVSAPLLILEPTHPSVRVEGAEISLAQLLATRMAQGRVSVVALPKWSPGIFPGTVQPVSDEHLSEIAGALPFEVRLTGMAETDAPPSELTRIVATDERGRSRALELHAPLRVRGGVPLLEDAHGAFVVHDGRGLVYVVADADLVHSAAIHRAQHGDVIHDLVVERIGASSVVVDEVLHGQARTRSLAELFGRWPGVLLLVHLVLFTCVVLLAGRLRFGPPDPPPPPRGQGPAEVIGVAADVLASGGRPATLAIRYVQAIVEDVARRSGIDAAGDALAIAERIDAASASRGAPAGLASLVRDASALPPRASESEARALALRAHTLRGRLVGGPRAPGAARDTAGGAPS